MLKFKSSRFGTSIRFTIFLLSLNLCFALDKPQLNLQNLYKYKGSDMNENEQRIP